MVVCVAAATEKVTTARTTAPAANETKAAANGKDVRIGGGVATLRQYLQARLIDEMHLVVRPILMGRGEALFQGMDLHALGYEVARSVQGERALHVTIVKASASA